MNLRRIHLLCGGVLASVLATHQADAQNDSTYCRSAFDYSIAPTRVPAAGWKQIAIVLSLDACWTRNISRDREGSVDENGFPLSYTVYVNGRYVGVHSDVRLPEGSAGRGGAAISLSLSRPAQKAPPDLPPDKLTEWKGGGFDLGFLEAGLTSGYEASSDREQRNISLGAELRYGTVRKGWWRLAPSLVVRYERIDPVHSSRPLTDSVGTPVPRNVHARLSGLAYWRIPVALNGQLQLQGDVKVFRATGLTADLEAAGWKSGVLGGATVDYAPPSVAFAHVKLKSAFVRYASGKEATVHTNREQVSVGLELGLIR